MAETSKGKNLDPPTAETPIATNYRSFSSTAESRKQAENPVIVGKPIASTRQTRHENDRDVWRSPPSDHASHRGFSTSIGAMFSNVEEERVDCCALTCCGMFQSDRDRYLLTGVTPPSPLKRIFVHLMLPLFILFLAGFAASHIPDMVLNESICFCLLFLLAGFGLLQIFKGRRKHIEIRKDLLFTKYQIISNENLEESLLRSRPDDESVEDSPYYFDQSEDDFLCAHPCCLFSCYKEDRPEPEKEPEPVNFCSWLWDTCFPSPNCGRHIQFCGTCALAQEAREIERVILPPAYRRIDYITMQPYLDYYQAIYKRRWEKKPSPHGLVPPLSSLSIQILRWAAIAYGIVLLWCFVNPLYWALMVPGRVGRRQTFSLADFVVFTATLLQSIGELVALRLVTIRQMKCQLSIDANIKFFAMGFIICPLLASFWEICCGLVVRVFVLLCLRLGGVGVEADPEDQLSIPYTFGRLSDLGRSANSSGQDYLSSAGRNHPFLYSLYIGVSTFILASLIEEMCKYFGYRMIEHPDLLTSQDLRAARDVKKDSSKGSEKPDFFRHNISAQSRGGTILLAMLSVALGFSCCENLVYVFFYSGSANGWSVLVARTFFPVHPICAALQSIGVIKRDVEKARRSQLGAILLPAVLFHGFYDFFIVWIDYLATRRNNDGNELIAATASSFFVSVLCMALAVAYYGMEARKQRRRLINLDQQTAVDHSRLI